MLLTNWKLLSQIFQLRNTVCNKNLENKPTSVLVRSSFHKPTLNYNFFSNELTALVRLNLVPCWRFCEGVRLCNCTFCPLDENVEILRESPYAYALHQLLWGRRSGRHILITLEQNHLGTPSCEKVNENETLGQLSTNILIVGTPKIIIKIRPYIIYDNSTIFLLYHKYQVRLHWF